MKVTLRTLFFLRFPFFFDRPISRPFYSTSIFFSIKLDVKRYPFGNGWLLKKNRSVPGKDSVVGLGARPVPAGSIGRDTPGQAESSELPPKKAGGFSPRPPQGLNQRLMVPSGLDWPPGHGHPSHLPPPFSPSTSQNHPSLRFKYKKRADLLQRRPPLDLKKFPAISKGPAPAIFPGGGFPPRSIP